MKAKISAGVLIAIGVAGVVGFLARGAQIKAQVDDELFKLTFQFLIIVVLGGAVSLLYQQISVERDERRHRRDLLREMHSVLLAGYNDAKRVRRKLRAQVGYSSKTRRVPSGACITADKYAELMEELMDAQLTFEIYSKRANRNGDKLWFATSEKLAADRSSHR